MKAMISNHSILQSTDKALSMIQIQMKIDKIQKGYSKNGKKKKDKRTKKKKYFLKMEIFLNHFQNVKDYKETIL